MSDIFEPTVGEALPASFCFYQKLCFKLILMSGPNTEIYRVIEKKPNQQLIIHKSNALYKKTHKYLHTMMWQITTHAQVVLKFVAFLILKHAHLI